MSLASTFTKLLLQRGSPTKAAGQVSYMKSAVKFYGLTAPEVTALFKEHRDAVSRLTKAEVVSTSSELIASEYSECKSLAIHLLKSIVKDLQPEDVSIVGRFIDDGHVKEWATCDTLSSVVGAMLKRDASVATRLQQWKDSSNLWKQRCACVSFVTLARHGQHNDCIIDICSTTVKNQERFAQLGTGWVLRELYLADPARTVKFIKDNYHHFSREGLRYAIEKMDASLRRELLDYEPPAGSGESATGGARRKRKASASREAAPSPSSSSSPATVQAVAAVPEALVIDLATGGKRVRTQRTASAAASVESKEVEEAEETATASAAPRRAPRRVKTANQSLSAEGAKSESESESTSAKGKRKTTDSGARVTRSSNKN